ncbi:MAG: 5' nucleotidase, NT5C type [Nitrososphaeraceae archaeon]
MTLEKIKEVGSINGTEFTIFVDLDGVLVDFDKHAKEVFNNCPSLWPENRLKGKFWKDVTKSCREGNPFFLAMDPMPDAFVLWNYIKDHNPTILSATGSLSVVPNAKFEKREWVKQHLGELAAGMGILVQSAIDKAQYSAPNHILIDDRVKAIEPWIAAGGIGILHTSAEDTIRQLKEFCI